MASLTNNVTVDTRSAPDIPRFECYGFHAGHAASDLNFDFKGLRLATVEVTVEGRCCPYGCHLLVGRPSAEK